MIYERRGGGGYAWSMIPKVGFQLPKSIISTNDFFSVFSSKPDPWIWKITISINWRIAQLFRFESTFYTYVPSARWFFWFVIKNRAYRAVFIRIFIKWIPLGAQINISLENSRKQQSSCPIFGRMYLQGISWFQLRGSLIMISDQKICVTLCPCINTGTSCFANQRVRSIFLEFWVHSSTYYEHNWAQTHALHISN
jgi:hypothetical protein